MFIIKSLKNHIRVPLFNHRYSSVAVSVREVSYCGLISIALTASIAAPILVEIFLAGGTLQVKWEMIQEEDMQKGLACQGCLFSNAKVELFWWSNSE